MQLRLGMGQSCVLQGGSGGVLETFPVFQKVIIRAKAVEVFDGGCESSASSIRERAGTRR